MSSEPKVVEFDCPKCHGQLQTSAKNSGKKIRCAKCQAVVTVPALLSALDVVFDDSEDSEHVAGKPAPADEPKPEAAPIDFDIGDADIDALLDQAATDIDVITKPANQPPAKTAKPTSKDSSEIPPKLTPNANPATPPKKVPVRQPAAPAKPKRVISNEDLPEKQKLKKKVAQRLAEKAAREKREQEIRKEVDYVLDDFVEETPEVPDSLFVDEDEQGEDLLSQVESIEARNTSDFPEGHFENEDEDSEEDLSPLHIDGISNDKIDVDDLYGVKCNICDTRIHVTEVQVGTQVDCPVCYSKVDVTPPRKRKGNRPSWMPPKKDDDEAEEAEFESPIMLPPEESEKSSGASELDHELQFREQEGPISKAHLAKKKVEQNPEELEPELQLRPETEPTVEPETALPPIPAPSKPAAEPEPELEYGLQPLDEEEEKDVQSKAPQSERADSELEMDEELSLSDPIERPKVEFELPEVGLPDANENLLAPKPKQEDFDSELATDDLQEDLAELPEGDEIPQMTITDEAPTYVAPTPVQNAARSTKKKAAQPSREPASKQISNKAKFGPRNPIKDKGLRVVSNLNGRWRTNPTLTNQSVFTPMKSWFH